MMDELVKKYNELVGVRKEVEKEAEKVRERLAEHVIDSSKRIEGDRQILVDILKKADFTVNGDTLKLSLSGPLGSDTIYVTATEEVKELVHKLHNIEKRISEIRSKLAELANEIEAYM